MSQENCFDGQDMRSGTGMRSGFEQALSHLADLVILLLKLRKLSAVVENTPNCAKLCARLVAIFSLSGLLISEFLVMLIIAEWSLIIEVFNGGSVVVSKQGMTTITLFEMSLTSHGHARLFFNFLKKSAIVTGMTADDDRR